MVNLREVQKRIIKESIEKLEKYGVVYIAAEMRVGKTLASAYIADMMTPENATIFVCTPLKVIEAFAKAFKDIGIRNKNVVIVNPENLHKILTLKPYFSIIDEAHSFGKIGGLGVRGRQLKRIVPYSKYVILMSGTPTPESEAQIYNQFKITGRGPFSHYRDFYAFARHYVRATSKYVSQNRVVTEYKEELTPGAIKEAWNDYKVVAVAEEAGIYTKHNFIIDTIEAPPIVKKVFNNVVNDNVVVFDDGYKVSINNASQRMHATITTACGMLYDTESDKTHYLSDYKIRHIISKYSQGRTVIFYYYVGHEPLFKKFGIQTYIDDRSRPDMVALQVYRYSHGVSLKDYDRIVYLQPVYSNKHMIQSIRRADDPYNDKVDVIFVMSDLGIEKAIFDIVMEKNDRFQAHHFEEWRRRVLATNKKSIILELPFDGVNTTETKIDFDFKF